MIICSNIKTRLGEPEEIAISEALLKLKVKPCDVKEAHLSKTSLDARHVGKGGTIRLVHSVVVHLEGGEERLVASLRDASVQYKQTVPFRIPQREKAIRGPILIAGFGPSGMFAADLLARQGLCPIVLERGGPVEEREKTVHDFWTAGELRSECNVQFGEGGAGTFSDGKLTTRINDPLCDYVLERFAAHGAPSETLKKAKPHIGTDKLRGVVRSMREEIINNGGQVLFHSKLEGIRVQNGVLTGALVNGLWMEAACLLLCVGHSARDTFETLLKSGVFFESKAFSVGARIEHRQEAIDKALYGDLAGHPALPKGEYQLSHREGARGVYTFCMCPGGTVVPSSSEEGGVVTNGMSEYLRDKENANAALVVSVDASDFGSKVFDGIRFQRELEQRAFAMAGGGYRACGASADLFLSGKAGIHPGKVRPSYKLGVAPVDFDQLFPSSITGMMRTGLRAFDRKLKGFAAPDAFLIGPETRTSSPVRITRGEDLHSITVRGLFPCGEGAGYAGGIMSAAVDGVRVALRILEKGTQ